MGCLFCRCGFLGIDLGFSGVLGTTGWFSGETCVVGFGGFWGTDFGGFLVFAAVW